MHVPDPSVTTNQALIDWVEQLVGLCKPKDVRWCDGSDQEWNDLCAELVSAGTFSPVESREKRPNSYLAWSDPQDVARVEDRTYICSRRKDDAGVSNNWESPKVMRERLNGLF